MLEVLNFSITNTNKKMTAQCVCVVPLFFLYLNDPAWFQVRMRSFQSQAIAWSWNCQWNPFINIILICKKVGCHSQSCTYHIYISLRVFKVGEKCSIWAVSAGTIMKVFYFVEYRMERLVNVKNLVEYINRIKEMTKSCEVTVNICRFM